MDGAREQLISSLREKLDRWQSANCETNHAAQGTLIPSGCDALDQFLPQGGFLPGQLIEWLSDSGSAAATLAMLMARQAAAAQLAGNAIVVVDAANDFYPPAAADWGINLSQLIVVRPSLATSTALSRPQKTNSFARKTKRKRTKAGRHTNLIWALDQSLRCPAVAAVWSYLPAIDTRSFRRLQLAAEEGRTLALLIRDINVRGQPSWSDIQIHVRPLPSLTADQPITRRRCQIELWRCRWGAAGASLELEIDELDAQIRSPIPRLAIHPRAPGHEPSRHQPHYTGQTKTGQTKTGQTENGQTETGSGPFRKTHSLPLASQLARPAASRRQSRA